MWRRASLLLICLGSMACAAATSSVRPVTSAGRNVITAAEIVTSHVHSVYQAVLQLRPEFLKSRTSMPSTPFNETRSMVYVDGVPFGPVESLRQIPLDIVRTIKYIRATEANIRYGGVHTGGVIEVTTNK